MLNLMRIALALFFFAYAGTAMGAGPSPPAFPPGTKGGCWIEGPGDTILMFSSAADGSIVAMSSDLGLN